MVWPTLWFKYKKKTVPLLPGRCRLLLGWTFSDCDNVLSRRIPAGCWLWTFDRHISADTSKLETFSGPYARPLQPRCPILSPTQLSSGHLELSSTYCYWQRNTWNFLIWSENISVLPSVQLTVTSPTASASEVRRYRNETIIIIIIIIIKRGHESPCRGLPRCRNSASYALLFST